MVTPAHQLGNDQHAGFDEGKYAHLVEPALDMFVAYFSPDKPTDWTS